MEHLPTFINQLDIDYISHHGVKGMHWGVRRYQNADGSYTDAGKARRGSKKLINSKSAKVAAGVAIKAAKVAAVVYASKKLNDRNINAYCEQTRKNAVDFVSQVDRTYHACEHAVSGKWNLIAVTPATCRTNAQNTRREANNMFEAYSKSRRAFANHPAIRETDKVMSATRDSLLQYADDFDKLADKLTKRQNTTQ